MNKKECRKFADPGLLVSPGSGLLHNDKIGFAVRAAVRIIARRRMLALYFYDCKKVADGWDKPSYALFQCRDDYITLQSLEGGATKWLEASLDNLGEQNSYFTKTCALYLYNEEQTVSRFCGFPQRTGFEALNALQFAIMDARRKKRTLARERSIKERMKPVPAVPRGLKGWIHREVLPHYVFYKYKKGGKPMDGYCTACRHDVLVSGAKHNSKGKCPRCGKAVTFKASGIAKRIWDQDTVQALQKTRNGGLLLRVFKITNSLSDWRRPRTGIWESARFFIKQNDDNQMDADAFYHSYNKGTLTHWQHGYRPQFSRYQMNFDADLCGHLYIGSLDDALAGTPWQYCQLRQFYRKDAEPMEVLPYLSAYLRLPAIEYLVKLGLHQLASDIVYHHTGKSLVVNVEGKSLKEILQLKTEDIQHLQSINASFDQLAELQKFRAREGRFERELYQWCFEKKASYQDVSRALQYTTGRKLLRYIAKQDEKAATEGRNYGKATDVLRDYNDYLRNGEILSYDFSDRFVLFPRHLKAAHDLATDLVAMKRRLESEREEKRKKEEAAPKIESRYKTLSRKFQYKQDGLAVVPPKCIEEIISEGHTLHHCVGDRYRSHASGSCTILFIRKEDSMDEPFCTMEISNGDIVQVRGYDNRVPTPEVTKFLEQWKRKKLSSAKTAKAA